MSGDRHLNYHAYTAGVVVKCIIMALAKHIMVVADSKLHSTTSQTK